jgi:UPF0271 protein
VKPHGALYNQRPMTALARAIASGHRQISWICASSGRDLADHAQSRGGRRPAVAAEAFADRAYNEDGSLVAARSTVPDPRPAAADQAVRNARSRGDHLRGWHLPLEADTICLHGTTRTRRDRVGGRKLDGAIEVRALGR